MDVLKQFDLEFDDLHACLNSWMGVSPTANDELQQKRDNMTTASSALTTSSGLYSGALAATNEFLADLGKAATAGQGKYFETASLLEKAFTEASAVRDEAAKASLGVVGSCADKNDGVRQAVVEYEGETVKEFTQLTTTVNQSQQTLTAGDTACKNGHDTVGKSLRSIKTTLAEQAGGSAKLVAQHSGALGGHARQTLPQEFGKVIQWVSQDLQPGQVAIVSGTGQAAGQAFSEFALAVNKFVSQGGGDVTKALTAAGQECSAARQQLAQQFQQKTKPLLDEMSKKQVDTQKGFKQGYQTVIDCAQKLGDLRGKFEAVRRNT